MSRHRTPYKLIPVWEQRGLERVYWDDFLLALVGEANGWGIAPPRGVIGRIRAHDDTGT